VIETLAMKENVRKFLEERGYTSDNLTTEGEIFALISARAQKMMPDYVSDEFPHTRAIVVEFCKWLVSASEAVPKPTGLGKDFDEMLIMCAFVRVFADREQLRQFALK
jgi:hypothetical protein